MDVPPIIAPPQQPGTPGITLKLRYQPMAFLYEACKPIVAIDGIEYATHWGEQFLEVAPGMHKIEIYFQYMWLKKCGYSKIDVEISATHPCIIDYYKSSYMYGKGKITRQL